MSCKRLEWYAKVWEEGKTLRKGEGGRCQDGYLVTNRMYGAETSEDNREKNSDDIRRQHCLYWERGMNVMSTVLHRLN